jgi:hypothetical protein
MMDSRSRSILGVSGDGVRRKKAESAEPLRTSCGVGGSEMEATEFRDGW